MHPARTPGASRAGLALLVALVAQAGCTSLFAYPDSEGEDVYGRCHDAIDNDYDGKIDETDPGCAAAWREDDAATCMDAAHLDEDGDGKSNCADPDCSAFCPEGTASPGTCTDGIDNDADGDTDCDDAADCAGLCPEDGRAADGQARCTDGVDNDGDGRSDAADALCWPVQRPDVQRCAVEGAVLRDRFATLDEWYAFTPIAVIPPFVPPGANYAWDGVRSLDTALFPGGAKEQGTAASDLDLGVGSRTVIAGDWAGFRLAFSVDAPDLPETIRVSLFPLDAAPEGEPPYWGEELLEVGISGGDETTVTVRAGGQVVSASSRAVVCLAPDCVGGFRRFSLEASSGKLRGRFAGVALDPIDAGAVDSFEGSLRVVISGPVRSGMLDDIEAGFAKTARCGFVTPQLTGTGECSAPVDVGSVGDRVALAHGRDGYCALGSVDSTSKAAWSPAVRSWPSPDGVHFGDGSELTPPLDEESDATVGLSVAWDDGTGTWVAGLITGTLFGRAAVDRRRYRTFESSDCRSWRESAPLRPLPDDADSPGILVEEGQRTFFYSRPGADDVGRTLWRVTETESQGVPIAEFGADLHVEAPLGLVSVGDARVITYRLDASAPDRGFGAAVSDRTLRDWKGVTGGPLLSRNPTVGFDDLEIRSAAVTWDGTRGVILYGALGRQHGRTRQLLGPAGAAGTALLALPGETTPASAEPEDERDGGAPDAGPTPGGEALLDGAWVGTSIVEPNKEPYVDVLAGELVFDAYLMNNPSMRRSLPARMLGDFELAFDVLPHRGTRASSCTAYLGLTSESGGGSLDGVFVHLTSPTWTNSTPTTTHSPDSCHAGPVSIAPGLGAGRITPDGVPVASGENGSDCTEAAALEWEEWQHVVLSRTGDWVRIDVERRSICGPITQSIEVSAAEAGATSAYFDALVVGTRDVDGGCKGDEFSLRDVRFRSLTGPEGCAGAACPEGDGFVCVDVDVDPEHCGGCDTRCGAEQVCVGGACACGAGWVDCGGACVAEGPGNCGGCGLDPCGDGSCVFGGCSSDVGEACDAETEIPAEGGTAVFRLTDRHSVPFGACGLAAPPNHAVFGAMFRWTPSHAGVARISLNDPDAGYLTDAVLGFGTGCGMWLGCENPVESSGIVFEMPVEARPYFLSPAALYSAEGPLLTLKVELL